MIFRCGNCQAGVISPDSAAGQQVACPNCGATNSVPAAQPYVQGQPTGGWQGGYRPQPDPAPQSGYGTAAPGYGGQPAYDPQTDYGYDPYASAAQPAADSDPLEALAAAQQTAGPYGGGEGYAANPYGYGGGYGAGAGGTLGYQSNRRAGPSQQGMAVAGFVLSLVFPLAGLIVSWLALNGMKANRNYEGKGLAQAGLIISIVCVALGFLWLIIVFGFFVSMNAAAR
jgi:hypothetical protein